MERLGMKGRELGGISEWGSSGLGRGCFMQFLNSSGKCSRWEPEDGSRATKRMQVKVP